MLLFLCIMSEAHLLIGLACNWVPTDQLKTPSLSSSPLRRLEGETLAPPPEAAVGQARMAVVEGGG
jgi:hypothetical protein